MHGAARRVNFQGIEGLRAGLPQALRRADQALSALPEAARLDAIRDTRPWHRAIFGPLLPPGLQPLAGTYRGTPGTPAEHVARAVFVARRAPGLRNRDLCTPAADVANAMAGLADRVAVIWAESESAAPPPDTAYEMLAGFSHGFLSIHPFVDGNGHVFRLIAPVLAARLGLRARPDWTLHPRPYDHVMSLCLQWYPHHPALLACYLRRWFDPSWPQADRA